MVTKVVEVWESFGLFYDYLDLSLDLNRVSLVMTRDFYC